MKRKPVPTPVSASMPYIKPMFESFEEEDVAMGELESPIARRDIPSGSRIVPRIRGGTVCLGNAFNAKIARYAPTKNWISLDFFFLLRFGEVCYGR